jgi:hypothetical protein
MANLIGENKSREKLWKALKGEVQTITAGSVVDAGSIDFTANPTEEDTFTINSTVFTFWDSGNEPGTATTEEITIGGTLAITLASCETKVEAHGTVGKAAGVIMNADVTDTDTMLSMEVAPNVTGTTLVSSTNGVNTTDVDFTGATAVGRITMSNYVPSSSVRLEWLAAGTTSRYITLADGYEGQRVNIYNVSQATAGDKIYIYGNYGATNNMAYLEAATDYGTLEFISDQWRIANMGGTNGIVLSASSAVAL